MCLRETDHVWCVILNPRGFSFLGAGVGGGVWKGGFRGFLVSCPHGFDIP